MQSIPNHKDYCLKILRARAFTIAICYLATSCHVLNAYTPQMVRWEVRATVTDVVDPLGIFPDVRLGDPVRGMLKYDVSLYANPFFSGRIPEDLYFTNQSWIDTVRMVVENPRSGTELEFVTDVTGAYADVEVFNDYPDSEHGDFDGLYALQSVVAPPGYTGESPVVAVLITGPTSILPTYPEGAPFTALHPPAELNLEDWPIAAMEFWDGDFEDPNATNIEAEIYSLTPVIAAPVPGDYDFDGIVDGRDLVGWQTEYGDEILQYTDGNGDGVTNGADFLVWQRNFGRTSGSDISASLTAYEVVPEQTTIILFSVAMVSWLLIGNSRC
jgi:hypothetical protein